MPRLPTALQRLSGRSSSGRRAAQPAGQRRPFPFGPHVTITIHHHATAIHAPIHLLHHHPLTRALVALPALEIFPAALSESLPSPTIQTASPHLLPHCPRFFVICCYATLQVSSALHHHVTTSYFTGKWGNQVHQVLGSNRHLDINEAKQLSANKCVATATLSCHSSCHVIRGSLGRVKKAEGWTVNELRASGAFAPSWPVVMRL